MFIISKYFFNFTKIIKRGKTGAKNRRSIVTIVAIGIGAAVFIILGRFASTSDVQLGYAEEIKAVLESHDFRVEVDGKKEMENRTVSLRKHQEGDVEMMAMVNVVEKFKEELKE